MSVILSVKQLNMYVRSILESDKNLRDVTVVGELSGFKLYSASGHAYFTLKDNESAVSAVMFARDASGLKFLPHDGMKVFVTGRISVYEKSGQYQLYAIKIVPDGIGAEFLAFEQLKEKLEKEGLFDTAFKKPLPKYPKKIGVISSLNGAAIHDFCVTIQNRYPFADVLIRGATVQGEDCPTTVISAINEFKKTEIDVLIITRGGGSFEDLAGFNDERLARAVFAYKVPVVSAIGHETDFTILDFVADFRAATPTAAAQAVTPSKEDLIYSVSTLVQRSRQAMINQLDVQVNVIGELINRANFNKIIEEKTLWFDNLVSKIKLQAENRISDEYVRLDRAVSAIGALNPLSVLSRGYALPYYDKKLIQSVNDVEINNKITLRVKDGEINCNVTDKSNL